MPSAKKNTTKPGVKDKRLTGMEGVYLVAAELSRHGFIASVTSRNAAGADILATDQECQYPWTIQVKSNASTFSFWLLSAKAKTTASDTLYYALVNLKKNPKDNEMYFITSNDVSDYMEIQENKGRLWYFISRNKVVEHNITIEKIKLRLQKK